MTLSDDEKWLLAENLRRLEKEGVDAVERGQASEGKVFEAYHSLATGRGDEDIVHHAVTDAAYLANYAEQFKALLADVSRDHAPAILDAGCGHGPLTAALAAACPGGEVRGVDLSESAIAYANKTYPNCRFQAVTIDENTVFDGKFDAVHAREFYAFTRTSDLDFHRKYVSVLAKAVSPGGLLILSLLSGPKSLAVNADALSEDLRRLGMSPFRRIPLADMRLSFLPLNAARALTAAIRTLTKGPTVHFYVARRKD